MRRVFRGDEVAAIKANEEECDDRGIPLRCTAPGCPNRWSVDMGNGRLCSWHDRATKNHWQQVTDGQLYAQTERARRVTAPKPYTKPLTVVEELSILASLKGLVQGLNPRAWAYRLMAKRERGEKLSAAQRKCLAEFESRHGGAA